MQQAEQARRGFGGPVLPGRQWVPWVHIADVAGLIVYALEDERVRGPLNVVAPGVVRNREFMATLARVVGKPARFPVPGVLLSLGFGITADTIVHGRRVVPRKALDLGYTFRFAALEPAIRDLLAANSCQPAPATAG
jgi:NAD dependent epimerase/dehydratase family enzyme